jgi:V/A-type H+-transporting ATPase subunit D
MTRLKLTKSSLRLQQSRLKQLQKYLPTLKLKKNLMQLELNEAKAEMETSKALYTTNLNLAEKYGGIIQDNLQVDLLEILSKCTLDICSENIAGVEVPRLEKILFHNAEYSLFDTPIWFDSLLAKIKELIKTKLAFHVSEKRTISLRNELINVSIRVNLFEKVLIPKCEKDIKKIKIFLGDQELASIGQMKIAKRKIEAVNLMRRKRLKSAIIEQFEKLGT